MEVPKRLIYVNEENYTPEGYFISKVLSYVYQECPEECVCGSDKFKLLRTHGSFRAWWKCESCSKEYHIKEDIKVT